MDIKVVDNALIVNYVCKYILQEQVYSNITKALLKKSGYDIEKDEYSDSEESEEETDKPKSNYVKKKPD